MTVAVCDLEANIVIVTFPERLEVTVLLLEPEMLKLLTTVSVTRMEAVPLRLSFSCDGVVVELCETERVDEIVAEMEVVMD